ncbi:MAG: GspE/PulE family protein [Planctomycetota bacterium]
MSSRPTLEAALQAAGLDEDGLAQARSFASSKGVALQAAVVSLNLLAEDLAYRALSKSAGLPFVDPAKAPLGADIVGRVPVEQIEQNHALPVADRDGVLYVAIDDPMKSYVADEFGFFTGGEVRCAIAPAGSLKDAIQRVVRGGGGAAPKTAAEPKAGGGARSKAGNRDDDDAPIARLVEQLVGEAVTSRASDIHIEPFETQLRVRTRVDGVLRESSQLDIGLHGSLTSRIKILASMDIAERRKPQDGRIEFHIEGRAIDVRTSVLPSNHGETVVMRLLDKERGLMSLEKLGFEGEDRDRFERIIQRPNGIVLVTGPTGSGKTTTLYAALKQLNRPDVKIITAEDPVEFNIAGINQCQVKSGIGLDFARVLRAMLRQAPNVILVGEIRDRETAEIAVQAALTGHLVFSTLHTNDAASAVTRLVDMGVKPFLVSAAVQAVLAQRLVRVLCPKCKEPYDASESELRTLGLEAQGTPPKIYRAVGCDACDGRGYRGRLGLFELLELDGSLREMIFQGEPAMALKRQARQSGAMQTLTEDGVRKVLEGTTSVDELLRVTSAH